MFFIILRLINTLRLYTNLIVANFNSVRHSSLSIIVIYPNFKQGFLLALNPFCFMPFIDLYDLKIGHFCLVFIACYLVP